MILVSSACFLKLACGGYAQTPGPEANATVKVQTLNAHSEMESSSSVVHVLKRGDSVYLDLQVDQSGVSWCGVRGADEPARFCDLPGSRADTRA
jgi:hypothetical protein